MFGWWHVVNLQLTVGFAALAQTQFAWTTMGSREVVVRRKLAVALKPSVIMPLSNTHKHYITFFRLWLYSQLNLEGSHDILLS